MSVGVFLPIAIFSVFTALGFPSPSSAQSTNSTLTAAANSTAAINRANISTTTHISPSTDESTIELTEDDASEEDGDGDVEVSAVYADSVGHANAAEQKQEDFEYANQDGVASLNDLDSPVAAAAVADETLSATVLSSIQSPLDFAALKADRDLMTSLQEYLSRFGIKLPQALISRVDKTDLCAENALGGLKYYCLKMDNGQYYDPWNPWCGYIECHDGVAIRRICQSRTWMGMSRGDQLFMTKDDMCRRPLGSVVVNQRCVEATDFNMCNDTRQLEINSTTSSSSQGGFAGLAVAAAQAQRSASKAAQSPVSRPT